MFATNLMWRTVLLLSRVRTYFMTFAWYGHLKYRSRPLLLAIHRQLDDRAFPSTPCRFQQTGWVTANSAGFS